MTIPATVICAYCDKLVPDDSERDRFCSDDCYDNENGEDRGTDYDAGPGTSDRGILRDEFHR